MLRPDWPALPPDAAIDQLAAAIRAEADAQLPRGGRAHILGQGLGALVALELALGRRNLAASLTLVAGHAGERTAVAPPPWVGSALADALDCDAAAPPDAINALRHVPAFSDRPAPLLPAGETRAQLRAAATADSYARLPRLRLPTLLLHGGADILVLPDNTRLLALRIRGAQTRIVPGAGHALVQERPALVGALLRDFIARHD